MNIFIILILQRKILKLRKIYFFFYLKKIKLKNFFYLFKIIQHKLKNFILVKSIKGKNFTYISQYLDNKDLRVKLNSFFNQDNFIFEIKNAKSFSKVDKKSRNLLSKSFTFNGKNDFEKFIKKIYLIIYQNVLLKILILYKRRVLIL